MKLREVIDDIMKAGKLDQTALGKKVGAIQSMVSRMRKGDDWEQHWQIFLKLLPLCKELGIDPAQDLKAPTDPEVLKYVESNGKKARRDEGQGKKRNEKAATRTVPARRTHGNQGKETRQD